MLLHGSCAARGADAVLLLGPPGCGKSDLVLRLMQDGWTLVADDQVRLDTAADGLRPSAPPALAGVLEVRGLGLLRDLPVADPPATLRLTVRLADRGDVPRLPEPDTWRAAGQAVPLLVLHAFDASTPRKLALALDAATDRARLAPGALP